MEQAGADALELNIYYIPTDLGDHRRGGRAELYCDLVRDVKQSVQIPVAVKLGPYFSSMANMARRLDAAGADGLVLFNRFYQPDFDLEALEVVPNLILSNPHELLLRLHWIAVLYGNIKADLALTGGVHSATDVIKAMMAGAQGRHDDLGAAAQGHQLPGHGGDRDADLDGPARVQLDPPDAGQHEPQVGGATGGLRARQLHEGAQLLHRALDLFCRADHRLVWSARVDAQARRQKAIVCPTQTSFLITSPPTSVSRKSRSWNLNVSLV